MVDETRLRIGDVARLAGASVRALRYYEEQTLLRPERTSGGQRTYRGDAVDRVRLLKRLFAAGLSSANIAALLPCVDAPDEQATAESVDLMRREHDRLSRQIDDLIATREQLAALIETTAEPDVTRSSTA